ncbi:magnesium-translocating P-type ATPase [Intestinirhabdus alba]|jgi:Mg2+-importing ATPase|uniref:Magnesium-transporting ATPase, P-type 1 n=1 Tax=Intestinirhabdus alba TaxID=2899544 RepID=A0A6L6IGZ7_9ENTR|nr:magnesium-translocating P-type ATPase [Intestinirhabdus alba]MTH46132.1 magnesium-translocating P-type ATPase [Intestinirhabdus alba]
MTDMKIENRKANRFTSENDRQHKKTFPIETEAFHSPEQTLARLNSSRQGLTAEEALERLAGYGRNEVAHDQAPAALIQLLQAFNNPFIFVLIALAAVSFFTDYWLPLRNGEEGDLTGIIIILTMIALSGLLRFWQEFRTNKAAHALRSMVSSTATVLRRGADGEEPVQKVIPVAELVPGDIILLAAGDRVPADVRLLASRDLFVSQSILSGESLPVEKYDVMASVSGKGSERLPAPNQGNSLLEMGNICLMGTNVTSGRAQAVVVATGRRTWFGSLAKSLVGARPRTAFDRGVNSVSWLLIRFMLVMVPVVLLINGFSKGDWVQAMLFALAVAVGLTPEMLPMIVSSNLAKGAIAMSRRNVIVKRLNAIQNLGAMDVLCTDKTGTLTEDNIILEQHLDVNGAQSERVLTLAWLNSRSQSGARNPIDQAVLRFGEGTVASAAKARFVQLDELPFDFVRRRVSVSVADEQHGDRLLICKGAVEEMLTAATHLREGDGTVALDGDRRKRLLARTEAYNAQGFRVLLVATRRLDDSALTRPLRAADEQGLTVEGMLTFLDPPKASAGRAIAALRDYGVAIKVLTGDNPAVTGRICLEVGIDAREILTGAQIEAMSDSELAREVETCTAFARLTPQHKSRILKMLQKNGHTVGFLGDGINDAPALRDADVGISVDGAADIAKASSDIILLEKDLMVLEEGVIKGRETFGNIIKYLNMTASSNFGNVLSVLVASAFLPFLPMLAIHLLIQNLLYDFAQLSLPWDKMDRAFLRQPRKWDAKNIGRFMLWIGPTSSLFDITTFALMWYVFAANHVEAQALFQSGWFIEGLLSQTLVVHMLRTQKIPFIQSRASLPVLLSTALVTAIGIAIPFSPLGAMVNLEPLPISYFPWLAAILLSYCLVAQGMKRFYIRRFGQWF